jgi:hypothetical protein
MPISTIGNNAIASLAASKLTGQVADANAPSGSVIQVVSTTIAPSYTATTSSSYIDSGLSLGITLLSSSSKVLIMVNGGHAYVSSNYPGGMIETICRQSSTTYASGNDLANAPYGITQIYNSTNLNTCPHSMHILDTTPSSTTPTYRVFFRSRDSGDIVVWQEGNSFISMTLMEIAA